MMLRAFALTLVGLFLPLAGAGIEITRVSIDISQTSLGGELRSHGKAWVFDTDTNQTIQTATLGVDHSIEEAQGSLVLTLNTFTGPSYEAIIWARNYEPGECYEGAIAAFRGKVSQATGLYQARSAPVCTQTPSPVGGEEGPPINQDPECECDPEFGCSCSPILIDMQGNGFRLSGADDPVVFDIDAVGSPYRISWTAWDTDDAFLVLDRNGNGFIDDGSELFGSATPQPQASDPNGFLALAVYDSPEHGGNLDGKVSRDDAIFDSLLLWTDADHDAISEPWELTPLRDSGIQAITLDYHLSRRSDRHGNWYRWSGRAELGRGFRSAIDVIFVAD